MDFIINQVVEIYIRKLSNESSLTSFFENYKIIFIIKKTQILQMLNMVPIMNEDL